MNVTCPYDKPFKDDNAGKIAYVFISAFSGSISIIGSSLILYIILRGGWTKLSRTSNRLMFSTSIIDIFSSVAIGLSIIPTPQETECSIGMGNLSTCAAQGFFIQLSLAVPAYNAMLSLYYLLTIRYGMNQVTIAKKYELFMHTFALVPALSTAIIGVANKMFFSEAAVCWIGDICQSNGNCPSGNIWGKGYELAVASICFTGLCMITTVFCMLTISWTLRQRNLATLGYRFQREKSCSGNRQLSRLEFAAVESAKQAYLYATAYLLTYIWGFCGLIVSNVSGNTIAFPLWFHFHVIAIFLPLQGMWNFFAYIRPMVSKIRRDNNNDNISYIAALRMILSGINTNTNSNQCPHTNEDSNTIARLTDNQDSPNIRRASLFTIPTQEC